MAFNSFAYALFLLIVFLLYWTVLRRSCRVQNILLLAASYIFYGWWDWRFLSLILLTTVSTYLSARATSHRRTFATLNIAFNLLILLTFKYFNFFSTGLQSLFAGFGITLDWITLDILLPVGISFYTFQAIGYSVDVFKGETPAEHNFITFATFISFFPQLVAGPIERASRLMPQFNSSRHFDYGEAVEGMRRILWGLFKKCVVADGLAYWVDLAYGYTYAEQPDGATYYMMLGVVAFTFQVYGDFSGYCDIARGSAQLLGFRLSDNFLTPYFSRNAIEFWRRWHRTLMEWFTTYVYFPLGGSRHGNRYVNVTIVFLLSGLWHGAKITFVAWGALCALWYIASLLLGAKKYNPISDQPVSRRDWPKMAFCVYCWTLLFIVFRSDNLSIALGFYRQLALPLAVLGIAAAGGAWLFSRINFSRSRCLILAVLGILFTVAVVAYRPAAGAYIMGYGGFFAAAAMLIVEWHSRHASYGLACMPRSPWLRYPIYALLYVLILTCTVSNDGAFIYFQF